MEGAQRFVYSLAVKYPNEQGDAGFIAIFS